MGSIVPVAFQAVKAFQTISSVAQVFNGDGNNLALQQLQSQQALQQQNATQNAQLTRDEIAAKAKNAEQIRKAALKRSVAKRRAEFGASGVGTRTGSSEAVLLGLFDESEEEKQQRLRLDNIKLNSLDQGLAQRRATNTLTRTQLNARQKLNRTSDILGATDDLLSIF